MLMDPMSMIFTLSNLSIYSTFVIIVSKFMHKQKNTAINYVIISSFAFAISLNSLYFDIWKLLSGGKSFILTFITFFTLSLSLTFFNVAIIKIYESKLVIHIKYFIAFGILIASFQVVATYFDSYNLRGLGLLLLLFFHLVMLIISLKRVGMRYLKNIFFVQSLLIAIFVMANSINALLSNEERSLHTATSSETIYTSLVIIIILTMYLSFLAEMQYINSNKVHESNNQLIDAYHKIKVISEIDQLTNLINRKKTLEILEKLKLNSDSTKNQFSIFMLDVNNFKYINDKYGHNVGDQALIFIAESLEKVLRSDDFVCRWGGDEFMIIANPSDDEKSQSIIHKIHTFFSSNMFSYTNSHLSLSIGYVLYQVGEDIQDVINEADLAMYHDKNNFNQTHKQ